MNEFRQDSSDNSIFPADILVRNAPDEDDDEEEEEEEERKKGEENDDEVDDGEGYSE
jgi:hypothetical protein